MYRFSEAVRLRLAGKTISNQYRSQRSPTVFSDRSRRSCSFRRVLSSATGSRPLAISPFNCRAHTRAASSVMSPHLPRVMRLSLPRIVFWNMRILAPVGVTFTPRPWSAPSQRNVSWRVGFVASIARLVRVGLIFRGRGIAAQPVAGWRARQGSNLQPPDALRAIIGCGKKRGPEG